MKIYKIIIPPLLVLIAALSGSCGKSRTYCTISISTVLTEYSDDTIKLNSPEAFAFLFYVDQGVWEISDYIEALSGRVHDTVTGNSIGSWQSAAAALPAAGDSLMRISIGPVERPGPVILVVVNPVDSIRIYAYKQLEIAENFDGIIYQSVEFQPWKKSLTDIQRWKYGRDPALEPDSNRSRPKPEPGLPPGIEEAR